jgi:outer membrane protein assembly factor BamB
LNPASHWIKIIRVKSIHSHLSYFAGLVILLTSVLSARAAEAPPGDWPQFLGPTRNGVVAGAAIAPWAAGGPPVVWKRDVGAGFAGPVVSGGKLVLFHRMGDKETVECLDAGSGRKIWLADYPTAYVDDFGFDEGPRATPAVVDGKVFTFGADGALNCWALATGGKVWGVDVKESLKSDKGFFGRACSPLVEGKAVVLNVGGGPGAGVVAFDKDSGKVLWKATDDEAGYSSPAAATLAGRRCVLSFTRAGLVGLGPGDGAVLFSFPWRSRMDASVNAATPLVNGAGDDEVFLTASYGTGAVLLKADKADAAAQTMHVHEVWSSDDALSSHYATPVYRDGFLYGYHGRQESGPDLRCVEWATGKVRWSEDHFGAGSLVMAGDKLLVLSEKGQLLLAPATPDGFKPLAKAQVLPFECRAYPALAGGLFYARSKDKLVCLDLRAAAGGK